MKKIKKADQKQTDVLFSQSFSGKVITTKEGKKIVLSSPSWYQYSVNKLKDGESVTVQVHNKRTKRTDAQNRYYWGVYLPLVAKETGELNLDRLHELFKGMFLTEGIVEVLGQKVRMKKSTTELSKSGFNDFITAIEAETGIIAPPTENYDLDPLERNY